MLRPNFIRTALALFLLAGPAAAQEFGQWWWRGNVGLGYKSFQNTLDGTTLADYEQQELEIGLDLSGFVIHPAVGTFDLGLDVFVSQLDGTQTIDTDRFGAHGSVELFQQGKYPIRLFAERQSFDYTDSPTDEPFTLLGAPETLTRWGGRGRLRTGALKGSLFGFERTTYDLLESVQGNAQDIDDTQFFDWSRTFGDIRHRLRIERRERQFGAVDVNFEDYIINLEEGGDLGELWRWDLNSNGIYRTLDVGAGSDNTFQTYYLRNRFLRPVRKTDLLDIRHSHGITMTDTTSDNRHTLSVFYRWRPRPSWEIGPFGEYSIRSTSDVDLSTPRLGVLVAWNRAWDTLTAFVTSQVSYSTVSRSGNSNASDESRVGYSFSSSFNHRPTDGFSEELELEMARDEQRTSPGPLVALPDLGVGLGGLGTQSKERARLTVEQRWRVRSVRAYGEWTSRQSDDMLTAPSFDLESVTGNLILSGRRWSLRGHVGQTDISRTSLPPERLEFLSATASLRPLRFLQLRATYRMDTRQFELLPSIDSEQTEVEATLELGQILFEARAFERLQDPMDLDARTSKGLVISLSRRFGGWLPVVTGDGRRGSIR